MKKLSYAILFFFICMIVVKFEATTTYAMNFSNLSSKIIKDAQGHIVEYGVKYEVEAKGNGEKECLTIYNGLFKGDERKNTTIGRDGGVYSLQFETQCRNGYIQYIKGEVGKIIIYVAVKKSYDGLADLRSKVEQILTVNNYKYTYSQYIRAKTEMDLIHTNELITGILKESGASKVKSIKITNGYSITALTGMCKPMKDGGELIDLNCALCSYKSGNYIIIGNPVIITSY